MRLEMQCRGQLPLSWISTMYRGYFYLHAQFYGAYTGPLVFEPLFRTGQATRTRVPCWCVGIEPGPTTSSANTQPIDHTCFHKLHVCIHNKGALPQYVKWEGVLERLFDCFLAHDNDNDFLNQRLKVKKGCCFIWRKGSGMNSYSLVWWLSLAKSHGMVDFSLIFLGESVICIVVALNILAGLTRGT